MIKRGFVIVEVLVAFIILTTAMSLLTYSQKSLNETIKRLNNYENIYMTVLSLKNKIDIELQLGDKERYEGKLNGINYYIVLKKIKEGNNQSFDNMEGRYIKGFHDYMMYKVTIDLYEINKKYTFFKLKTYFDETLVKKQLEEF